eukprot:TRINITY_DN2189_c0_g1_i2.p3 TRINITY_DN2189_c0_g1~~TRINITY_DN2189_c0_g1_i2.p3  ORF type:complete len:110 (-),score=23.47 TRINITY_DN2189_c0_g1_i2:45-374(-)
MRGHSIRWNPPICCEDCCPTNHGEKAQSHMFKLQFSHGDFRLEDTQYVFENDWDYDNDPYKNIADRLETMGTTVIPVTIETKNSRCFCCRPNTCISPTLCAACCYFVIF